MIRINLLPFRLARKRENIRRQVSVFFLSILLAAVGLTWYTLGMDKRIAALQHQIARIDSEIAGYNQKAEQVAHIQNRVKRLENKLEIVASLELRRDAQLLLLEDLQTRIVPEQMWIESIIAEETAVTMTGIAFDNATIADFMRRLEASDLFQEVDLKQTVSKRFDGNLNLKAFELRCRKQPLISETR
jgi:type IV pilus assembly protein PilN